MKGLSPADIIAPFRVNKNVGRSSTKVNISEIKLRVSLINYIIKLLTYENISYNINFILQLTINNLLTSIISKIYEFSKRKFSNEKKVGMDTK